MVSASGVTPQPASRRATGSVTLLICGRAWIPSMLRQGYRAGSAPKTLVKIAVRVEAAVVHPDHEDGPTAWRRVSWPTRTLLEPPSAGHPRPTSPHGSAT